MESKIMVTIPCQFSSSWSSNKCHVCLLAKSIVWVLPPGGLSKVPNSPKFPASLAMGFLEKKNTWRGLHSAELPVSQGTERMRLVLSSSWAFWYRWFSLCKRPTHIPYTLYTRAYTFNGERELERCLAWFVVAKKKIRPRGRWSGSEESRERVALFGKMWLFWNRLFTTSCFDFSTMFESLLKQELHKSALQHSWSECSCSTSRLI